MDLSNLHQGLVRFVSKILKPSHDVDEALLFSEDSEGGDLSVSVVCFLHDQEGKQSQIFSNLNINENIFRS